MWVVGGGWWGQRYVTKEARAGPWLAEGYNKELV